MNISNIITGVEGSLAASLSIDMRGVMPVPPPMNTWKGFGDAESEHVKVEG